MLEVEPHLQNEYGSLPRYRKKMFALCCELMWQEEVKHRLKNP